MADELSRRMYRNHRAHLNDLALRELDTILSTAESARRSLADGRSPMGDQRRLLDAAGQLSHYVARLESYDELAYLLDDPGEASDG